MSVRFSCRYEIDKESPTFVDVREVGTESCDRF